MTGQVWIRMERYARKSENHAHNAKNPQELGWDNKKSGKVRDYLTGSLEKSSIMRISLSRQVKFRSIPMIKGLLEVLRYNLSD